MLRLAYVLVVFFTMTPAFIASLWLLERLKLPGRRAISIRYCRALCALLRVRVHVIGQPAQGSPALIVCNHVSWLDIPVISAICPVAYVARHEVASWPVVGVTARLQRTVFVNRARRTQTAAVAAAIAQRLGEGDPVVLFAEGTSSDGNRVLGFRSALIGAGAGLATGRDVLLQPASISYTRMQGIPMGRRHRPLVAWYGDLDFTPHFKAFIRSGAVDITVTFGAPVPYPPGCDRKATARTLEATVRRLMATTLRGRALLPATAA
jgi:1-acyl-sn-glycerol-3-phosphate acyltransferase